MNLDLDLNFDFEDEEKKTKVEICDLCKNKIKVKAYVQKQNNIFKKAIGELNLFEVLPKEFKTDDCIHCLSGGDVDSLSYISYMLKFQNFKYMLLSTWCMANADIYLIKDWLDNNKIGRVDAYVGEIFPNQYKEEYENLKDVVKTKGGRICVFKNHSKIYAVKGENYDFIVESSANINTNPRAENTNVTIGSKGFNFYKNYFDNIKSFNRDFDNWTKMELK